MWLTTSSGQVVDTRHVSGYNINMTTHITTCVVPSNRPDSVQAWLDAWRGREIWDRLVIVWDLPSNPPMDVGHHSTKYCWQALEHCEHGLGEPLFSRRDSAIRSYGFFKACEAGADLVVTLDDDCYPGSDEPVFYEQAMRSSRWCSTLDGHHVRGLPYRDTTIWSYVHVGLWHGVPDLDAMHALVRPYSLGLDELPTRSRVMAPGTYYPMCGMNLAFRREALPLMMFAPSGEGFAYRRFDDIWCGVIAQRVLSFMGFRMTYGPPHVRHARASDPYVNLVKEAPGVALNEKFWQVVDGAVLTGITFSECVCEIAAHFSDVTPESYGLDKTELDYLRVYGERLVTWCKLVQGIV